MARPLDVEALKQLALLGALDDAVELASSDFGRLLDLSQQTASRRLIELDAAGWLQREVAGRKQRLRLTPEGAQVLADEYALYQRLFEAQSQVTVTGTVKTGLGEGRYYLSRPGYTQQFRERLGWTPYAGTLNLDLDPSEAGKLSLLRRNVVHPIEPFQAEGRTFGGVNCNPARIGAHACAAILPHRSHYTTTLEIIAPARLRDALPCRDGDRLQVVVDLRRSA